MDDNHNDFSVPFRTRIELKNHILSVLDCGPRDGKVVILLHGFPTSAEIWRPLQARLAARGYRSFAPDLPGSGKTVCLKEMASSWQDSLAVLQNWLETQPQIKDIWWCGHQLGALMALECAERFSNRTERCTLIAPILSKSEIFPEPALAPFKFSLALGLYFKAAKKKWLEKLVLMNRKTEKNAIISPFDRYVHQRLLFNDKVSSEIRQAEFVHFFKSIPKQIPEKITAKLASLKIPKQVIFDVLPEEGEGKALVRWLASLAGKKDKFPVYQPALNTLITIDNIELISLKASNPYLPLAQSLLTSEAQLLWANKEMTNLFMDEYKEAHKKPEPLPDVPKPDILIDPALSLPPDGKPEHVQRKAPAKKKPARKNR